MQSRAACSTSGQCSSTANNNELPQGFTEQPSRNQKSHHEDTKKSFAILRVFVSSW